MVVRLGNPSSGAVSHVPCAILFGQIEIVATSAEAAVDQLRVNNGMPAVKIESHAGKGNDSPISAD